MAEAQTFPATTGNRGTGMTATGANVSDRLRQNMPSNAMIRQLTLILGLAIALALLLGIFFWAQEPNYRTVYGSLPEAERARIAEALQLAGRDFRIDNNTGAIQVPAGEVHETRLLLAAEGLPKGQGFGYEMLQQDQRFGTSQFMETARFQRALETELARSISFIAAVESARVHLALPRESVFIRESSKPSASVAVNLASGRGLSERQVNAIVHMVASSVPEMDAARVTVVDQRGNLLTKDGAGASSDAMSTSGRQFEYQQLVESTYARRIEDLLTPTVGRDRVKAQVSALIDFSHNESTEEMFDPDRTVIRSEQINEDRRERGQDPGGVPGALTNQPPGAGQIGEGGEAFDEDGEPLEPVMLSNSVTRNFEVGKTIRHTRRAQGGVERLTIAVLVDEPTRVNDEGETVREPLSEERLQRLTALVRDAVGFDEARGDSVNVISAPFHDIIEDEGISDSRSFMEQPWVLDLGRWLLASIVALVLILLVIRPLVNGLLKPVYYRENNAADDDGGDRQLGDASGNYNAQEQQRQLSGMEQKSQSMLGRGEPAASNDQEAKLEAAREIVGKEPAMAANLVKNWLSEDGPR